MKQLIILAALSSASAFAADDQVTVCKFGESERKISIVYPQQTQVPCEVQYTKNGESQVLWSARAETGYCEEKAAAFIEKQKNWGWECNLSEPTAPEKKDLDDPEPNTVSMIAF